MSILLCLEAPGCGVANWLVSDLAIDLVRRGVREVRVEATIAIPRVEENLAHGGDAGRGVAASSKLGRSVDEVDPDAVWSLPRRGRHGYRYTVLPEEELPLANPAVRDVRGVSILVHVPEKPLDPARNAVVIGLDGQPQSPGHGPGERTHGFEHMDAGPASQGRLPAKERRHGPSKFPDRRLWPNDLTYRRTFGAGGGGQDGDGRRIEGPRDPNLVGEGSKRAHEKLVPIACIAEIGLRKGRGIPFGEIPCDTEDEGVLDFRLHQEGPGGVQEIGRGRELFGDDSHGRRHCNRWMLRICTMVPTMCLLTTSGLTSASNFTRSPSCWNSGDRPPDRVIGRAFAVPDGPEAPSGGKSMDGPGPAHGPVRGTAIIREEDSEEQEPERESPHGAFGQWNARDTRNRTSSRVDQFVTPSKEKGEERVRDMKLPIVLLIVNHRNRAFVRGANLGHLLKHTRYLMGLWQRVI